MVAHANQFAQLISEARKSRNKAGNSSSNASTQQNADSVIQSQLTTPPLSPIVTTVTSTTFVTSNTPTSKGTPIRNVKLTTKGTPVTNIRSTAKSTPITNVRSTTSTPVASTTPTRDALITNTTPTMKSAPFSKKIMPKTLNSPSSHSLVNKQISAIEQMDASFVRHTPTTRTLMAPLPIATPCQKDTVLSTSSSIDSFDDLSPLEDVPSEYFAQSNGDMGSEDSTPELEQSTKGVYILCMHTFSLRI